MAVSLRERSFPLILLSNSAAFQKFLTLWQIPHISSRFPKKKKEKRNLFLSTLSTSSHTSAPCCSLDALCPHLPLLSSSLVAFAASSRSLGQESTQAALLTRRQNRKPGTSPSLTANQANHHFWRTCAKHLTILLTRRVSFLTSSPKSADGFQKVAFSQSLRHCRALAILEGHQASKQSSSACWRRLLGDPHILLLADHNTSALSKFSFKEFQTVSHSVPTANEVQSTRSNSRLSAAC